MSAQRIDDTVMENIEILAKLSMSEDEREEMRTELEKILDYVEKLNELDTENVEAASHIFPLENVFREDQVTNGDAQEEMLENQMRELEGSLLLCRKLGQEKDLLKADPEKYLQFIQKEEQKGRRFSPAEELLGELSDFTAECYGGSGWFTAVFGSWADLVKLILGAGLWLFFLYMAAVRFMEEPASVSHIVFWTGLFLAYNLSFLKYWAGKRRTTQ